MRYRAGTRIAMTCPHCGYKMQLTLPHPLSTTEDCISFKCYDLLLKSGQLGTYPPKFGKWVESGGHPHPSTKAFNCGSNIPKGSKEGDKRRIEQADKKQDPCGRLFTVGQLAQEGLIKKV